METYFKLKVFSEYILPVVIFGLIILYSIYRLMNSWLRDKLMERLGYKYDRGLGTNVALEYQPSWKKGKIKINYRRIESLSPFKLKKFVKKMEEEKSLYR
jgi:hypothetical protein